MTATVEGILSWSASRNQDGHTDYHVVLLVVAALTDGPDAILNAAGIPAIGAPYVGTSLPKVANAGSPSFISDFNPWAFRWPNGEVSIHQEKKGENQIWYEIDILFSTRPLERCMTALPANPLSEPAKISGSFTKYTQAALVDRFGNAILTSSLENVPEQQVERDFNRAGVSIEMNFATFGGATWSPMIDTLNDATLWGLPPRCVKLSNVRWQRKLYSLCTYFYNFTYEFDIDFNTFDRQIADYGTKILAPGGNPFNPQHFIAYTNPSDNQPGYVLLNGSGAPWTGISGSTFTIAVVTNTAPPAVVTTAPNGFNEGDQVIIRGVNGAILINGTWTVTNVISSTSFEVNFDDNPGSYTSGGQVGILDQLNGPGSIYVQFYDESNFLLLGIPSSL